MLAAARSTLSLSTMTSPPPSPSVARPKIISCDSGVSDRSGGAPARNKDAEADDAGLPGVMISTVAPVESLVTTSPWSPAGTNVPEEAAPAEEACRGEVGSASGASWRIRATRSGTLRRERETGSAPRAAAGRLVREEEKDALVRLGDDGLHAGVEGRLLLLDSSVAREADDALVA